MTNPEADLSSEIADIADYFERSHFDRLQKLVSVVSEKLEQALRDADIPAKVSGRVKTKKSLQDKLTKWAKDPEKSERIKAPSETLLQVNDLAAVRATTYMERDRPKVENLVRNIFATPKNCEDFDCERKEDVGRIKDNDLNHYRATHMLVSLQDSDCTAGRTNLNGDICELQITSMLAHVWNEIEHDTIYKETTGSLSKIEQSAIDSLGLLTKTGDNIISNLLLARADREEKQDQINSFELGKFSNDEEMVDFLDSHFGTGLLNGKIDYSERAADLFAVVETIGINHPTGFKEYFRPQACATAHVLAKKISREQIKAEKKKSKIDLTSSDILMIAAFQQLHDKIDASGMMVGNSRFSSLFRDFCKAVK